MGQLFKAVLVAVAVGVLVCLSLAIKETALTLKGKI